MATIKSYTDISQSKTLSKILPLESADMNYWCGTQIRIGGHRTMDKDLDIPCWSLASLLGILPDELGDNHFLTLNKEGNEYCCCYEDVNGNSFRHTFADNPVDACYEMILKLNELKMM